MNQKEIYNAELGEITGPYAQGIRCGDFIFSVQVGNKPDGTYDADAYLQTKQTLANAEKCLKVEGASLADVVKCTIFIADMADYADVNRAYREIMTSRPFPSRTCVEVSKLGPGSKIEIEFTAYIGK